LMTETMKFLARKQKLNKSRKWLFLKNLVALTAVQNMTQQRSSVASADTSYSKLFTYIKLNT